MRGNPDGLALSQPHYGRLARRTTGRAGSASRNGKDGRIAAFRPYCRDGWRTRVYLLAGDAECPINGAYAGRGVGCGCECVPPRIDKRGRLGKGRTRCRRPPRFAVVLVRYSVDLYAPNKGAGSSDAAARSLRYGRNRLSPVDRGIGRPSQQQSRKGGCANESCGKDARKGTFGARDTAGPTIPQG